MHQRKHCRLFPMTVLLFCAGCASHFPKPAKSPAAGFDEFARVIHQPASVTGKPGWILQTSIRDLRHPQTRVILRLYSMHHLGEAAYFRAVDSLLREKDEILLEGWDLEANQKTDPELEWIDRYYEVSVKLLGLKLQPPFARDSKYARATRVDLPWSRVQEYVETTRPTILSRKSKEFIAHLERFLAGQDGDFKVEVARTTLLKELFNGILDYPNPWRKDPMESLNSMRDKAIFDGLKEHLRNAQRGIVTLVYGAAHMWKLEPRIVGELGFAFESNCWLDVMRCDESILGPPKR